MSLLKQDNTRKSQVDENNVAELDANKNESKEYKVETIFDSAVYAKKSKSGQLSGLYYLIFWKRYPKKENIYKLLLAIQHLRKLISLFYKNHFDKLTTNSKTINTISRIARLTVKLIEFLKQKPGQLPNNFSK